MTRKHTIFEPCDKHVAWFATETRRRRAEVMCEGGYAGNSCECRMKPGTDFYTAEFVAANPIYRASDGR